MSNLSEEEIIERVNKFIDITVLYGKTYGMTCDDLKKYQQVFRGLLDLYQQEKEKNFKRSDMVFCLKSENTKLKDRVKTLENADLTTVYINGFYDGKKKWKDKIRETQNKIHKILDENGITRAYQLVVDKEFEELLEEE